MITEKRKEELLKELSHRFNKVLEDEFRMSDYGIVAESNVPLHYLVFDLFQEEATRVFDEAFDLSIPIVKEDCVSDEEKEYLDSLAFNVTFSDVNLENYEVCEATIEFVETYKVIYLTKEEYEEYIKNRNK